MLWIQVNKNYVQKNFSQFISSQLSFYQFKIETKNGLNGWCWHKTLQSNFYILKFLNFNNKTILD